MACSLYVLLQHRCDREEDDRICSGRDFAAANKGLIIHICSIVLSNVLTPDLKYQVRERSNKNEKWGLIAVVPPSGRFAVPFSNKRTFIPPAQLTS